MRGELDSLGQIGMDMGFSEDVRGKTCEFSEDVRGKVGNSLNWSEERCDSLKMSEGRPRILWRYQRKGQ